MKKVALITNRLLPYDAISNYVCALVKQLSQSFSLSIFTFVLDKRFAEECLVKNKVQINFYTKRQRHSLSEEIKTVIHSIRLYRRFVKYDLIIIITERPVLLPILLAKIARQELRLVWDFHGITPPQYHRNIRRIIIETCRKAAAEYLMKYCDFCIVHSSFIKSEVERFFRKMPIVVPLGVDTARFNPKVSVTQLEKRYDLYGKFTLLYVGRLVPHKRVDFLIRAISKLGVPTVHLFVVGDGPEKDKLENYARSLDLSSQIVFTGFVSDEELRHFYSACDVFVTASLHEGVCLPILESFATGKPVIVPDSTAMPETAENGGLVYNGNSVSDLAEKIKILKDDRNLLQTLRKNVLAIAQRKSRRKTAGEYRDYLEKILK